MRLFSLFIMSFMVAIESIGACPVASMSLVDCLKFHLKHHRTPDADEKEYRPLPYCDVIQLKREGKLSEHDVDTLIDFAQKNGNPVLFRPIDVKLLPSPEEYSLNFLWIHKTKLSHSGHLFGVDDRMLQQKIIGLVKDWQEKQPEAFINIWYDGNMMINPKDAVANTIKVLQDNQINTAKITLKNLRIIPLVQENPVLFNEDIDIYFRVDLAKAVIADYVLRVQQLRYAINIDSDVVGITRQQLFDEKTMTQLNDVGYVLGKAFKNGWENSFILLMNNTIAETLENHKKIIIDRAVEKALDYLKKGTQPKPQDVFHTYHQHYGEPGFREIMHGNYFDRAFGDMNRTEERAKINEFYARMLEKDVILPASQFGSPGYSENEINALRKALVGRNGCSPQS